MEEPRGYWTLAESSDDHIFLELTMDPAEVGVGGEGGRVRVTVEQRTVAIDMNSQVAKMQRFWA